MHNRLFFSLRFRIFQLFFRQILKKIQLSYDLLKATTKLKEFKPCLKRYLFSHVKSSLYRVPVDEWEMVISLPSDNFEKATAATIWADSMHKMNN